MDSKHPVAVLGSQGQVGRALVEILKESKRPVLGLSKAQADLSHPETVLSALDKIEPSVVFNAAAYTAVDRAEQEPAQAFLINATAPGMIALWCAQRKIPLIHYSTDYVFRGGGSHAWTEADETAPLSAYGKSKLAGEQNLVHAGGSFLIFRTSWVYAAEGKNFLNTMLRLGAEREALKVVADQVGAPTFATDIALASLKAYDRAMEMPIFPSGIYHACNEGETSWNGFACAIFEKAREQGIPLKVTAVQPISTSEYPTPAKRPLNSRLCLKKIHETFGIKLPHWREGLKRCMDSINSPKKQESRDESH